ncbi:MAG: site-2 protease family protein [Armatimonadota bacterium]|nr:site-2 protease family protein [Armatimonadota bacterium]MDR7427840.1 site-2 protease family protein [Armatimonadota bacterium]MDR7463547.1 site-2 protease family protein [Armatimonadota bacterium]MDR7470612.1 site-2 protease family protein [Armatimonadota bacterium]MDR7473871.1 site-2 protease family protein [Armatimonadota bacterium]
MWRRWVRAIAILGGTVLAHELAHAVAAWRVGGRVREIAIGFGPRLLARRVRETTVSLRPLLVGGFAAIDVEALSLERRVPVLLAGPLANVLLGLWLLPRDPALRAVAVAVTGHGPAPSRVQISGVVGAMAMLLRAAHPLALRHLAGQINLSVGLANLLPLLPLDGGHLALAKMEAKGVPAAGRNFYRYASALVFLWFLLQVLAGDLRRLRPLAR